MAWGLLWLCGDKSCAIQSSRMWEKKIILSATRGQNLPQRPFAAVQPSDLILQICGGNPTRGRSHLRLFKPILVTHFFMQNISRGSLPSEELLSTAKEKKKESREQREKCRSGCGWRMWWCHRAQREHGAFKKPKETSWPSLVTSPPGSHTHTAESPSATRGKKAPSHHRICTGKNVSELWFAFPTSGASGGLGWISQQRVAGEVMLMNGSREADAEVWCSFSSRDMSSGLLCWLSSLWIKWKTMIHKNNNRMQVLYQRLRWLHSRKFSFWKVKPVRNLISLPFFLICTSFS